MNHHLNVRVYGLDGSDPIFHKSRELLPLLIRIMLSIDTSFTPQHARRNFIPDLYHIGESIMLLQLTQHICGIHTHSAL
ncbi:hypothetical protein D3C80_1902470 [compost metagenome]